jgi:Rrf2 family protein
MNLSAKTEYACLAMLELAQHSEDGRPVQARRIAERHGIPSPFLVQILQDLKRSGLVTSTRGASGGYRISGSPQEITLVDVLDAVEASEEPTTSAADSSPLAPVLLEICQELSAARRTRLQDITLAQLLEQTHSSVGPMWHI